VLDDSDVEQFQSLKSLDLSDNWLSSTIPTNIGSVTSLTELLLSFNFMFGTIPVEIGQLTNLVTLDISDNSFVGEYKQLGNTVVLDSFLTCDSGVIPIEVVNLPHLKLLNATGNVNLTLPE